MAGQTTTVTEKFDSTYTEKQIQRKCDLRIKAGAVSSTYKKNADGSWTITTVWKKIGD